MSEQTKHDENVTEAKNEETEQEQESEEVQKNAHEQKQELEEEAVSEETAEIDAEKEKLKKELEELNERFLRVQADYDNFRRRTKLEKEAALKYRAQSLAEQLLPVLDNFERALSVVATNEESESILKGVDMVYRQLQEALRQEGIEEVEAEGVQFDPNKHQAVMQDKSEEHESGIVLEVLQKGYILKDRIIRPAMVKVNE